MSNSCCINLGHTGPDDVQVTIIRYNIYQTLKLLIHTVLTLVTLDQMAYKSQSSGYHIYQTPGGGGDSHMKQTGMLVWNFEFNP